MARPRRTTGLGLAETASTRTPAAPASLKVRAVKDGFYPKDFRRRKGSVFTLRDAAHFSDAQQERVITCAAGCRRHKHVADAPVRTGSYGWMEWVDAETPERLVTAADVNNEAMQARMGVPPPDESVI